MPKFKLDLRLENDSLEVGKWGPCLVRLMNDSRFPWLLLVPEAPEMRDLHDLPAEMQASVSDEVHRASRILSRTVQAEKMNVAALGNMVPQLHIHVIARFHRDEAWPGPVWGVGKAVPYQSQEADDLVSKIKTEYVGETT